MQNYLYDELNRLINVNDMKQDVFDEIFAYDAQGRIVAQRRDTSIAKNIGGEYAYYAKTNRLEKVADGMGGTADERNMSDTANFVYDSEGNLTEDKYLQGESCKNTLVHFYCRTVVYCALRNSKRLKISYDWRGMPVEFRMESKSGNVLENTRGCSRDGVRVLMAYDGSGRRISKTRMMKTAADGDWLVYHITHYTGIGTEVRETHVNGQDETKVVVNMPNGLGRYQPEDAVDGLNGVSGSQLAGYRPPAKFEWYLKNHLGSTMLVYGTQPYNDKYSSYAGGVKAAYDYRAFGEQVDLTEPTDKVTENFTGKEKDDETELNYFGARYLDPMLGLWTSVDPARQFSSPYLYAGNGVNPVNGVDEGGNVFVDDAGKALYQKALNNNFWGNADIRREYEFANSTSTRIFLRRQEDLIGPRELTGTTQDGVQTQISLMNGVPDDFKMLDATVTLSNEGSRIWAEELNITFDEAEARTAAHEFGAHIRGASLKTSPNMRESVEHGNYKEVDERLETAKDQCRDYE